MLNDLIKTDKISIRKTSYPVRYFELRTMRGSRRFWAEITLGPDDKIILDDDSLANLETRTQRLIPATVYSRTLSRSQA